ncbi:hypothetical protein L7F22_045171 [Adiantum nelumboides]|nr:hypothetical protein [Adiantum nelumboides]
MLDHFWGLAHFFATGSADSAGVRHLLGRIVADIPWSPYYLVESDKVRNGNREALTALRKIARTSQTSVPMLNSETIESGKDDAVTDCRTCGDYDRSEPLWFLSAGGDFFMDLPFHEAHLKLEMEQKQLDITVNKLHSKVKDQTLSLSEKGALADKIGPSILKSLVTLKDNR